jgi:ubiquinone/menaquinone biosynthesis C-methylase UbiE
MNHTDTSLPVASGHQQQLAAWDGDEGTYWADHAERFDRSIAAHQRAFLAAMEIAPDTRALDVGCGTGQVTRAIASVASRGSVLGVDLSARMLDVARAAAAGEGLANVTFEQADAQIHPFELAAYDLVAGRTSAMFFADKVAAFGNLARSLHPAGQLALLVWQEPGRNEWFTAFTSALAAGRALPAPPPEGSHPFSLADPEVTRPLLEGAGLNDPRFDPVEEPMYFGSDTEDAFGFVSGMLGWMVADVDEETRATALDSLRATIAEHETPDGVIFSSAAWLVTARR